MAAPPHAVKHANVWLWADFLKFSLSIFFSDFFFELLCGATYDPQNIFHEGGLFIVHEKNVVIKEALAFESPGFFLISKKNWLPFDFLRWIHCFRLCLRLLQACVACIPTPTGFSLELHFWKPLPANRQWDQQSSCLALCIADSVCLFVSVFA